MFRYKEATSFVLSWLADTTGQPVSSPENIVAAAAAVSATTVVPVAVITALDFAIKSRIAVRTIVYHADMTTTGLKHQAFIETLQGVSSVLTKGTTGGGYFSQIASGAILVAKYGLPPALILGALHYSGVDKVVATTGKEAVIRASKIIYYSSYNPLVYFNSVPVEKEE